VSVISALIQAYCILQELLLILAQLRLRAVCATPTVADINAGEGLVRISGDRWRRIAPCPVNTYGVQGPTFNLQASPCRPCATNLRTDPLVNNTGWTNFTACYNQAGWGWSPQGVAAPCPDGTYNPAKSMSLCKACGPNRFTMDGAQASREDCLVKPGFGVVDGDQTWVSGAAAAQMNASEASAAGVLECPATHYGPGGLVNATCEPCPGGRLGSNPGASNATECDCKWE
jgi:hypothetical protein